MSEWPDDFDINDGSPESVRMLEFIHAQMDVLEAYDSQRPDDITYVFHEHAERVANNVRRTCTSMGLNDRVAENMYWAVLPHDIGKSLLPFDVWDSEEKPDGQVKRYRRTHTLLGAQIAQEYLHDIEHPFKDLMIDIMAFHHEQMDGRGTQGLKADALSAPVRLAAIVEAYDGYRIWRPHFGERDISPPAVIMRMRDEKGAEIYDMDLFESFAKMKMNDYKEGRILNKNYGEHV